MIVTARPVNLLITFISVWAAAWLSAPFPELAVLNVSLGALAAGLIAAFGNVHNDLLDLEVDRINQRQRPLPQGIIPVRTAAGFAVILALSGILLGVCLGLFPAIITFTAALLLFLYNYRLKMIPLAGNLTVSLLTALAFIFGGVLSGNAAGGIIPAVFSLFFHFSREMVKDVEDLKGDSARTGATYALKYGAKSARSLAAVSLAILVLIIPLPYFAHFYKIAYLYISLAGVVLPVLWVIRSLLKAENLNYRRISGILKLGMALGLIALIAGR